MISESEWAKLKESERYGMIAKLMSRVDELERASGVHSDAIINIIKKMDPSGFVRAYTELKKDVLSKQ